MSGECNICGKNGCVEANHSYDIRNCYTCAVIPPCKEDLNLRLKPCPDWTAKTACTVCGTDHEAYGRGPIEHTYVSDNQAITRDNVSDNDPINHPSHYTKGAVECIDAIESALGRDGFIAYCRGTMMAYAWRAGLKGDAVEDFKKANWYVNRAIDSLQRAIDNL